MKPFANRIESMDVTALESIISETHQENTGPMYFPNGDKWTGYTETDIFGNTYYEAVNKQGQPYRRMELPAARLL